MWVCDVPRELAPETLISLEAIGDSKVADLVRRVFAEFGEDGLSDYAERLDQVESKYAQLT